MARRALDGLACYQGQGGPPVSGSCRQTVLPSRRPATGHPLRVFSASTGHRSGVRAGPDLPQSEPFPDRQPRGWSIERDFIRALVSDMRWICWLFIAKDPWPFRHTCDSEIDDIKSKLREIRSLPSGQ